MRLGLQIPRFLFAGGPAQIGPMLAQIGREADNVGFASVWLMDHFFQIRSIGKVEEPMLEAYATLGFLAAHTQRVQLGTMVTGVMYRHPGALVKQVTTLDVLSGGRAWLGIGAGWYEREARGLGLPFPRVNERFELLEETLRIAKQMWRNDTSPIYGKHYSLAEPLSSPAPLQSAASADPDWRRWGAENAPPRRALRGRVQPVRAVRRGRATPQAGRPAGSTARPKGATTTRSIGPS